MMSQPIRILLGTVLAAGILQAFAPSVNAQSGMPRIKRPLNNPTVSPFLNLLSRGNNTNAGLNYHRFVRPQRQAHQQNLEFRRELATFERRQNQGPSRNEGQFPRYRMLGTTGHSTSFMSIGRSGGSQSGRNSSGSSGGDRSYSGSAGYSGHSAGFGTGAGFGYSVSQ